MRTIGISQENYNPQVLFVIEGIHKDKINSKYHCHDYLELTYIISGTGSYKVDNKYYNVKKGDLLPFNPNVYHREYISKGEEIRELYIGVKNFKFDNLPKDHIFSANFYGIVNFEKQSKGFLNCINEILDEQRNIEPGYDLVLKSLVMKLLVAILREKGELKNEKNYKSCTFESSEKTNIVRTIISFMTSNYMQDISLDKISKNMYLSPVYISKIFKEETGDSPINYLIKIRLDKAAQFLQKENEMTIKEISKKVGYDDAYYFSKLFKKHFTISPIEYKKKMQFVERGVNS